MQAGSGFFTEVHKIIQPFVYIWNYKEPNKRTGMSCYLKPKNIYSTNSAI